MTFTIYYHKRFVLNGKNFYQWECFFLDGSIIVLFSPFVLFIIRNIIVLLVGWWLGLMLLRLWFVVLALLGRQELILGDKVVAPGYIKQ